jgi:hypothetical protein
LKVGAQDGHLRCLRLDQFQSPPQLIRHRSSQALRPSVFDPIGMCHSWAPGQLWRCNRVGEAAHRFQIQTAR